VHPGFRDRERDLAAETEQSDRPGLDLIGCAQRLHHAVRRVHTGVLEHPNQSNTGDIQRNGNDGGPTRRISDGIYEAIGETPSRFIPTQMRRVSANMLVINTLKGSQSDR